MGQGWKTSFFLFSGLVFSAWGGNHTTKSTSRPVDGLLFSSGLTEVLKKIPSISSVKEVSQVEDLLYLAGKLQNRCWANSDSPLPLLSLEINRSLREKVKKYGKGETGGQADDAQEKALFWSLVADGSKQYNVFDSEHGEAACKILSPISGEADPLMRAVVTAKSLADWFESNGLEENCARNPDVGLRQMKAAIQAACKIHRNPGEYIELGNFSEGEKLELKKQALLNLVSKQGMTEFANRLLKEISTPARQLILRKFAAEVEISDQDYKTMVLLALADSGYFPEDTDELVRMEASQSDQGISNFDGGTISHGEEEVYDKPSFLDKIKSSPQKSIPISQGRIAFESPSGHLFIAPKDYGKRVRKLNEVYERNGSPEEKKAALNHMLSGLRKVSASGLTRKPYRYKDLIADQPNQPPLKSGEVRWFGKVVSQGQQLGSWKIEKIATSRETEGATFITFSHPGFAPGSVFTWTQPHPRASSIFWYNAKTKQVCEAPPGKKFSNCVPFTSFTASRPSSKR
jgi:hypothetical protein